MLELRILDLEPAGRGPRQQSLSTYALNTFELDIALQRLESAGEAEHVEEFRIGLPGLGLFRAGRVLSAPRIIAEAGLNASIDTVREVPVVEKGQDGEIEDSFLSGSRENEKAAPASSELHVEALWNWDEPGVARLEMSVTGYDGEQADHWEGEVLLQAGETGVIRVPDHLENRVFAVTVTFRPLTR